MPRWTDEEIDRLQFFIGAWLLGQVCGNSIYYAATGLRHAATDPGLVAALPMSAFFIAIRVLMAYFASNWILRLAWIWSLVTAVLPSVSPLGRPGPSWWWARELLGAGFAGLLILGGRPTASARRWRVLAAALFVTGAAWRFWLGGYVDGLLGRTSVMTGS